MRKALVLVASLVLTGSAAAQYKWTDQNGKVQYGDTPPTGTRGTAVRPPPPVSAPAPAPQGKQEAKADEAKKTPMTSAEKEADFRRRQQEGEKEREKQAKAQQQKNENCSRAREAMHTMQSGRVTRFDAKGERVFLSDSELAQESDKARREIQQWCS